MKAKPLLVNHHAPACLNFTWNGLLNSGRAKQWVYIIPFSLVNLLFRKMGRKISFFFFLLRMNLMKLTNYMFLKFQNARSMINSFTVQQLLQKLDASFYLLH